MALIDWADVIRKYPEVGTSLKKDATEVNSYHIPYAIAQLESALGNVFAVPFSEDNLTARDLAIDFTYLRLALGKLDKANEVEKRLMKKIEALQNGSEGMMDVAGTFSSSQGNAYSSDSEYHHVFGMGESVEFIVSSDQLLAERDARL